jgi:hypothetical protein
MAADEATTLIAGVGSVKESGVQLIRDPAVSSFHGPIHCATSGKSRSVVSE